MLSMTPHYHPNRGGGLGVERARYHRQRGVSSATEAMATPILS
jgi:hypothetical protein